jgi:branched-subunit amino acid permease
MLLRKYLKEYIMMTITWILGAFLIGAASATPSTLGMLLYGVGILLIGLVAFAFYEIGKEQYKEIEERNKDAFSV